MVIHVLGLGESLMDFFDRFPNEKPVTIGVNDIARYIETTHLVVLDTPEVFSKDRLDIIQRHKPIRLFSLYKFYDPTDLISLKPTHLMKPKTLFDNLYKSHNSPFVAAQVAASMFDVTDVVLWGVDFKDHKKLSNDGAVSMALDHYELLHGCMGYHNIKLSIGSDKSKLSKVLPIWES